MITSYKEHSQFILVLIILYVVGVWGGLIIYLLYPLMIFLYGHKKRYFELLIIGIWTLILADYVPVKDATHDDLQFAKDLKPLIPLYLLAFFMLDRDTFKPLPKFFVLFVPFLISISLSLMYTLNLQVGIQKTISFILMYLMIPIYVTHLHHAYGERFWKALLTFIIGMMSIGVVLGLVVPEIGIKLDRFKGVLGNPNGLATFLSLSFILWVIVNKLKLASFTKKERLYFLVIIFISLIWSGSRNGLMTVIIFYAVYRMVQFNWFLAILVLLSIIVFNDQIFMLLIGVIKAFGMEDFFRIETIEEGSGRTIAWVFAWEETQRYFLMGGGFGNDENIMRPNYYWLSRLGHNGGVHNSFLSMWMNAGLVGLSLYFFGLFRIIGKAMKDNYFIIACLSAILFNMFYESWLVASLNPFTIMYLIILTIFAANLNGNNNQTLIDTTENANK